MIKFALDETGRALPAKHQAGVISVDIAGEGEKVLLSDGKVTTWRKKMPPPIMPDWSKIESISHYFGRDGYSVYPAWIYHPHESKRVVANADEAMEVGLCYREATMEERGRYGIQHVWDWTAECQWRPTPPMVEKFDPSKPGLGKNYIPSGPNPRVEQNALIASLVPAVAEAVARSLQSSGPAAPAHVDPSRWQAFLQFEAFQKTQQAVEALGERDGPLTAAEEISSKLTPEQERAVYEGAAERLGIKVDGRWSFAKLKEIVDRAPVPAPAA